MPTDADALPRARTRSASAPAWGLGIAVALLALSMLVPAVTGWNVRVHNFPPVHADWDPRVGWGTFPAVVIGVLGAQRGIDLADRLPWRRLLHVVFLGGLAWMLALAFVDGAHGVSAILGSRYEYLGTARGTTDLHATLQEFVSRIPYAAYPRNWPVHVAGHPPGALVFFVVLVRIGLGSGFLAGLVVTLLAASTAVAVLVTLRTLGAETWARRAAPFLVLGPAAIWQCVSADAMFAAVAAWGLACLALGATAVRTGPKVGWSVLAGLLLGCSVMLSYGLPLLGIPALAVLFLARSWLPLPLAALSALAVVLAFAAFGFSYLEALPAIHTRYFEAVGGRRPTAYWVWGDFGALTVSAGPLAGAGVAALVARVPRPHRRVVRDRPHVMDPEDPADGHGLPGGVGAGAGVRVLLLLAASGVAMALTADLSGMSKAEVERIWLPFMPWVLLGCALLPESWRRRGLVLQVVFALVVQHLLFTGW